MIRRFAWCLLPLALVALYACKDEPAKPPAAGEPTNAQPFSPIGGSSGAADEDGGNVILDDGATAATCTDITLTGNVQDEEATAENLPAATGGTIAPGTYDLAQVQKYTGATGGIAGPTGLTYRGTIRITNSTSGVTFERDVIVASNAATGSENRTSGVILAVSPNATVSITCPAVSQEQYTYTAIQTSLVLNNTTTGESYTYQLKL